MSRRTLIAVAAAVLAAWLFARRGEAPGEGAGAEAAEAVEEAAPAAPATRENARLAELEMAVSAALGNAECGYSEVGYAYRAPDEATGHLVRRMKSAAGVAGAGGPRGTAIDYVEGRPSRAWQVAIRLSPDGRGLLIEGYGNDLSEPLVSRRVPCS